MSLGYLERLETEVGLSISATAPGTPVFVRLVSTDDDENGLVDVKADTLTVLKSGSYFFSVCFYVASNSPGVHVFALYSNGGVFGPDSKPIIATLAKTANVGTSPDPSYTHFASASASGNIKLSAGDTLRLQCLTTVDIGFYQGSNLGILKL